MKKLLKLILLLLISIPQVKAQTFQYEVVLEPIVIPNFPGLHSFAFAQDGDYWLIIGGRKDGLHARQPFASFPASSNNTDIYVVDINTNQFWQSSLNSLSVGIKEQLQSTNMNFYQDQDTLYIIGGYGYSASAADHITFNNLTAVSVSGLISAIVNSNSISPFFKQVSDPIFDVTGGQLGKIGNTFYLVGGHKFEGRYNPMGHATYVQTYTNQIRKFTINNSGTQLSFSVQQAVTDPAHLRRRDYNLVPQIYPNGEFGYMISSGVFQQNVDLPFLYPVDVKSSGIYPQTTFNQYLSNYHSAKVALYDSLNNQMHSLFFGGMSQYYYQNGVQIQDNNVPFVKTISRVTRNADGSLHEYRFNTEMPGLKGASAEFFVNEDLPLQHHEIVRIDKLNGDTIDLGYMVGGITSPSLNPFSSNQTSQTSADASIYKVRLVKIQVPIDNHKDSGFDFVVFPNPTSEYIMIKFNAKPGMDIHFMLTDAQGKLLQQGEVGFDHPGINSFKLVLGDNIPAQLLNITLVVNGQLYENKTLVKY